MILVVRVKLVLAEKAAQALPGVKMNLYDRDQLDQDDYLGSEVTDDSGEARFVFDSVQYTDREDQPAWRLESMPDLYVKVYGRLGEVVLSTREQVLIDDLPDVITVAVPKSLAEQHGLIAD